MTGPNTAAGSIATVGDGPDPTAAPLLSIRDLRVHFETKRGRAHAVDGVNLDIRDGETLGLVGETGSGKSVTARSILRLVPMPPGVLAGGEVLYRPKRRCDSCHGAGCVTCGDVGREAVPCPDCAGQGCAGCERSGRLTIDLLRIPDAELRRVRGDRIAMIFQDDDGGSPRLLRRAARQRSRVGERMLLAAPPFRAKRNRLRGVIDEAVATALADTRIPNPKKIMASYPHELSGGMKQRVMIAQALACDPDLLIADEPTTALDVTIQARILDLIAELQERHGTAVLYISHDLSLVRRICDRVAVLYGGQLAEVAPVDELFARPMHPYTRGLLAAIPTGEQARGELTAIPGTVPELIDPPAACRFASRCPNAVELCSRVEPAFIDRTDGGAPHPVACLAHADPADLGVDRSQLPVLEERP